MHATASIACPRAYTFVMQNDAFISKGMNMSMILSIIGLMRYVINACGSIYKVAKTHRIPYLCRSFSAKVTYI